MKWKVLQMPQSYALDESVSDSRFGRFVIEPLERGFGYTLGNTLRRVLLSSLQGAAMSTGGGVASPSASSSMMSTLEWPRCFICT